MDLKLSFILPIYKVEAYLPHCVNSILNQMNEECEIILVDDGSPDGSGRICDDYAARDPRIHVIHKENGGLSSARNAGMEIARGRYLCFVDSDDYIVEGTVSRLLLWTRSTEADVCFLTTKKVYPDGREELLEEALERQMLLQSREQALAHLATRPIYPGSAWAKLWRREFLLNNDFHFPGDRRLSEDLIFCLNAYLRAEKFDFLDFPFYCYRKSRTGSITNDISPKYFFDSFLFTEEVGQRFRENRNSPEGRLALSAGCYEYIIRLWEAERLQDRKQEAWEKLRDYRWILDCAVTRKTKMVRLAVRTVGLTRAAKLLDFYMSRRN